MREDTGRSAIPPRGRRDGQADGGTPVSVGGTSLTVVGHDCTILLEQGDKAVVFPIDPRDPLPLYAQLERAIRSAIATGSLDAGAKLPTVRQLAVDLRINANTVAKVYGELERLGVLETRRGVGTFVAAAPPGMPADRAERVHRLAALGERFLNEAAALGFDAAEAIASLGGLRPGSEKDHARREGQGG